MSNDTPIRHITDHDWDDIVALESGAYAALGLSEQRSALESRAHASPSTCFVIECDRRIAGYLLALPYPHAHYPDLARPEHGTHRTDNLHLHDLVVARPLRRRGLARLLLRQLTATAAAQAYDRISLVAVAGSDAFWSANGFTAHHGAAPPPGYGAHAVYMSRAVRAHATGEPRPSGALPHGSPPTDEVG
ncbi:GNAT family N-acetyltransferase [Streptacidiphilus sp. PB12-B1b]|uniref:GNAT family N-acetyltransferase n=1 Tax=Streptacidiphilus sp. PB12-B1b TaxID=2705012 RepID=UPI0015FD160C|nr:GNAT family N-acetyltransferase [Streptacidiphilus sp. PB12-B1b]QMU76630.1 GNAT family N-acetyltransferase [Streptacidiphilus sp. PB12-B1b]